MNLCLDDDLRVTLSSRMQQFDVARLALAGRRHAAVAFTLVDCQPAECHPGIPFDPANDGQAAFILTLRTARLSSHAGQYAYPGGRIDTGESPEQAALRELREEVGLQCDPSHIIGRLDDYATRSGYVISPMVIWGGSGVSLEPNAGEVAQLYRIPLRELLRDDAPMLDAIEESDHPVLKMPLGDRWFAAPSAAIAYQFREVALLGNPCRVAHFEQPHFAWR